jgi:cytochrome c556
MSFTTKVIAPVFILLASAAFAETVATDPVEIARQDLMKSFGGAAKTLGGMAGGKIAFDAAAAEAAKAVLLTGSAEIPAKFEVESADPTTKASPDIWKNWDAFLAKAKGLNDAATALDVSSAESIGAGMAGIGGACKDCHSVSRLQ